MIKSRRLEYVFEKQRKNEENVRRLGMSLNDPAALSISERADFELINELRFSTAKFMNISSLLGANVGYFTYRFLHLSLHWYIAGPLAIGTFLVTRNLLMRNALDKIYYASHDVYLKYKEEFDSMKKRKEEIELRRLE